MEEVQSLALLCSKEDAPAFPHREVLGEYTLVTRSGSAAAAAAAAAAAPPSWAHVEGHWYLYRAKDGRWVVNDFEAHAVRKPFGCIATTCTLKTKKDLPLELRWQWIDVAACRALPLPAMEVVRDASSCATSAALAVLAADAKVVRDAAASAPLLLARWCGAPGACDFVGKYSRLEVADEETDSFDHYSYRFVPCFPTNEMEGEVAYILCRRDELWVIERIEGDGHALVARSLPNDARRFTLVTDAKWEVRCDAHAAYVRAPTFEVVVWTAAMAEHDARVAKQRDSVDVMHISFPGESSACEFLSRCCGLYQVCSNRYRKRNGAPVWEMIRGLRQEGCAEVAASKTTPSFASLFLFRARSGAWWIAPLPAMLAAGPLASESTLCVAQTTAKNLLTPAHSSAVWRLHDVFTDDPVWAKAAIFGERVIAPDHLDAPFDWSMHDTMKVDAVSLAEARAVRSSEAYELPEKEWEGDIFVCFDTNRDDAAGALDRSFHISGHYQRKEANDGGTLFEKNTSETQKSCCIFYVEEYTRGMFGKQVRKNCWVLRSTRVNGSVQDVCISESTTMRKSPRGDLRWERRKLEQTAAAHSAAEQTEKKGKKTQNKKTQKEKRKEKKRKEKKEKKAAAASKSGSSNSDDEAVEYQWVFPLKNGSTPCKMRTIWYNKSKEYIAGCAITRIIAHSPVGVEEMPEEVRVLAGVWHAHSDWKCGGVHVFVQEEPQWLVKQVARRNHKTFALCFNGEGWSLVHANIPQFIEKLKRLQQQSSRSQRRGENKLSLAHVFPLATRQDRTVTVILNQTGWNGNYSPIRDMEHAGWAFPGDNDSCFTIVVRTLLLVRCMVPVPVRRSFSFALVLTLLLPSLLAAPLVLACRWKSSPK